MMIPQGNAMKALEFLRMCETPMTYREIYKGMGFGGWNASCPDVVKSALFPLAMNTMLLVSKNEQGAYEFKLKDVWKRKDLVIKGIRY